MLLFLSGLFHKIFIPFIAFISFIVLPYQQPVLAKTPTEIRNLDQVRISSDMHGQDLNGFEFIKEDLRGIDFGEADLRAAIFNNSQLQGADLQAANLEDAVAFASDFEGADLRQTNLSQALLMESSFHNAVIDGADFTDAVISRIQQKELCSIARGSNTVTGVSTSYSLGCTD